MVEKIVLAEDDQTYESNVHIINAGLIKDN